jgi:hypothetical protein
MSSSRPLRAKLPKAIMREHVMISRFVGAASSFDGLSPRVKEVAGMCAP